MRKVLLPEALPGLVAGLTTTIIALIGYTAMAGAAGAGGLGDVAIIYGYNRFEPDVMTVCVLLLVIIVTAVQVAGDDGVTTITVGASPAPHATILEYVDENLAEEENIDLEIKTFDDYVQPNVQLDEGTLDDITDLPKGGTIGINNDPSNQGRALVLLQDAGVLELEDGKDAATATINDIAKNPKNIRFTETAAAQLPRSLEDFDAAVINGNYAIEADLSVDDALFVEDAEGSPYANFLAVQKGNEDNEAIVALEELLHSPEVKKYIEKTWPKGEVLPGF